MATIKHIQLPDQTILDLAGGDTKIRVGQLKDDLRDLIESSSPCIVQGSNIYIPSEKWTVLYNDDGTVFADFFTRESFDFPVTIGKVGNYTADGNGNYFVTSATGGVNIYSLKASGQTVGQGYDAADFVFLYKYFKFKNSTDQYCFGGNIILRNSASIVSLRLNLISNYDNTPSSLPSTDAYGTVRAEATFRAEPLENTAEADLFKKAPRILEISPVNSKVEMTVLNFDPNVHTVAISYIDSSGNFVSATTPYTYTDVSVGDLKKGKLTFTNYSSLTTAVAYKIYISSNNNSGQCTYGSITKAKFWT